MLHRFASFILPALMGVSAGATMADRGLPANAKDLVSGNKVVVVDVREASELSAGMAKEAIHMPLSLIDKNGPDFKKFVAGLPRDKEIWLYCRSGRRSGIAAEKLNAIDSALKIRNIGGYADWRAAGLPSK